MRIDKTRFLTLAHVMAAPLVTACVVADDDPTETQSGAGTTDAPDEATTTSSSSTGTVESSTGSSESTSGAALPACVDEDIGSRLGETVASNVGLEDDFQLGCTTEAGAVYVVQWTAPAEGSYTFRVTSEAFDPLLGIADPTCAGLATECNDECPDGSPLLQRFVMADEVLHIVVETFGADGGPFALTIEEQQEGVDCGSIGSTGIDTEGDTDVGSSTSE
jgi:hypothetical protein